MRTIRTYFSFFDKRKSICAQNTTRQTKQRWRKNIFFLSRLFRLESFSSSPKIKSRLKKINGGQSIAVKNSSICCVGHHVVWIARCENSNKQVLRWTVPCAGDVQLENFVNLSENGPIVSYCSNPPGKTAYSVPWILHKCELNCRHNIAFFPRHKFWLACAGWKCFVEKRMIGARIETLNAIL